jgi:hypothetical protein
MRLRLAFKLNGDDAELARQLADVAGIPADRIAKLAMQRYMRDVVERAEEMMKQTNEANNGLQPSSTDSVLPAGTVSDAPDSVPSEEA